MSLTRANVIGVAIGVLLYICFLSFTGHSSSTIFSEGGKDLSNVDPDVHIDDNIESKIDELLEQGSSSQTICLLLQKRYQIINKTTLMQQPYSIRHHWLTQSCSSRLSMPAMDEEVSITKKSMRHESNKDHLAIALDSKSTDHKAHDGHTRIDTTFLRKTIAEKEEGEEIKDTSSKPIKTMTLKNEIMEEEDPDIPSSSELSTMKGKSAEEKLIPRCLSWLNDFKVQPRVSWGDLPEELQAEWKQNECDKILDKSSLTQTETETTFNEMGKKNQRGLINKRKQKGRKNRMQKKRVASEEEMIEEGDVGEDAEISQKVDGSSIELKEKATTALPKVTTDNQEWCVKNKAKYKVVPMKSWGSLPAAMIDPWKSRK